MILWIAASFIAFVVKGLCGFANTLVFTSVMAFGNVSNVVITPVEMLLTLPANLLMAWKQRKHADWKRVIPLCLLVLVG